MTEAPRCSPRWARSYLVPAARAVHGHAQRRRARAGRARRRSSGTTLVDGHVRARQGPARGVRRHAGVPPARRQPRRHPAPGRAASCRTPTRSTVSLCLDTGHISYCGGDNLEIIRAFPERIGYVHLKQVDPAVVRRVREERLSFARGRQARRDGASRPTGIPEMPPLLAELGALDVDLFADRRAGPVPDASRTCRCRSRLAPASYLNGCGLGPAPRHRDVTPSRTARRPASPRQKEGIMKQVSRASDHLLVATTAVLAAAWPPAAAEAPQDQPRPAARRWRRQLRLHHRHDHPRDSRVTPSGTRSGPGPSRRPRTRRHAEVLD